MKKTNKSKVSAEQPVTLAAIERLLDQKLGEKLDGKFESIDLRFNAIDHRFELIDLRFNAIDAHFERLEFSLKESFNAIEDRFDSMDRRFEAIDLRFDGMDGRLGNLEDGQDQIRLRLDNVAYRFELNELSQRVTVLEQKIT